MERRTGPTPFQLEESDIFSGDGFHLSDVGSRIQRLGMDVHWLHSVNEGKIKVGEETDKDGNIIKEGKVLTLTPDFEHNFKEGLDKSFGSIRESLGFGNEVTVPGLLRQFAISTERHKDTLHSAAKAAQRDLVGV